MPNTRQILIVDDDPELREALSEQLSLYEEFKAFAAEDGRKGVQAAKAGQIDLVIMDVGLPDIDGHEAVRVLRKNGFKAPTIISPSPSALPCCLRASAPSFASTRRARTRSSRSVRTRFGQARSCCSI